MADIHVGSVVSIPGTPHGFGARPMVVLRVDAHHVIAVDVLHASRTIATAGVALLTALRGPLDPLVVVTGGDPMIGRIVRPIPHDGTTRGAAPRGWPGQSHVVVGVDPAAPDLIRIMPLSRLVGVDAIYGIVDVSAFVWPRGSVEVMP